MSLTLLARQLAKAAHQPGRRPTPVTAAPVAPAEVKYHRDIYLPRAIEAEALRALAAFGGRYTPTAHATQRALQKGITLPRRIPTTAEVIEVTVRRGRLEKYLVRFDAEDGRNDIVLSLTPSGDAPTVYVNDRRDAHATLDPRPYVRPTNRRSA